MKKDNFYILGIIEQVDEILSKVDEYIKSFANYNVKIDKAEVSSVKSLYNKAIKLPEPVYKFLKQAENIVMKKLPYSYRISYLKKIYDFKDSIKSEIEKFNFKTSEMVHSLYMRGSMYGMSNKNAKKLDMNVYFINYLSPYNGKLEGNVVTNTFNAVKDIITFKRQRWIAYNYNMAK